MRIYTFMSYIIGKYLKVVLRRENHLRSPRLLCVRSLGSPWYDYVYFNSASSGIQWVASLLQWLTKLSVLNVSHYAIMNNITSVKLKWRCFKNRSMIEPIENVRVQSDKALKIQKIKAMCGRASLWKMWGPAKGGWIKNMNPNDYVHCCVTDCLSNSLLHLVWTKKSVVRGGG